MKQESISKTLFGINLLTFFCKLDHCIDSVWFKYLAYKSVSKLKPKRFIRLSSGYELSQCLCLEQCLHRLKWSILSLFSTCSMTSVYKRAPSFQFIIVVCATDKFVSPLFYDILMEVGSEGEKGRHDIQQNDTQRIGINLDTVA
jgi:hypothetical protein